MSGWLLRLYDAYSTSFKALHFFPQALEHRNYMFPKILVELTYKGIRPGYLGALHQTLYYLSAR